MRTNMHAWIKVFALGAVMVASSSARAAEPDMGAEATEPANEKGSLLLGGKVGGLIPFNGLSPHVRGGLEVGYVLPWMDRSFAVALGIDYAAPSTDGSVQDPRVPGGSYDWELRQEELAVMPFVMYRFQGLGTITPFAGIGPRVYMLRSTVKGSSGSAEFGETTETSTSFGVGVPLGAEFELGPGALLAELLLEYGGLDHRATGDVHTGGTSLLVGYRFFL